MYIHKLLVIYNYYLLFYGHKKISVQYCVRRLSSTIVNNAQCRKKFPLFVVFALSTTFHEGDLGH